MKARITIEVSLTKFGREERQYNTKEKRNIELELAADVAATKIESEFLFVVDKTTTEVLADEGI